MSNIKTHDVTKDIKVFDRAANVSSHMKDTFVKSKDAAEHTQDSGYSSPSEYASDTISNRGKDLTQDAAHGIKNRLSHPHQKVRKNVNKAKSHFRDAKKAMADAKRTLQKTRKAGQKTIKTAERTAKTTVKTAQQSAKAAQKAARAATKAAKAAAHAAKVAAKAAVAAAKAAVKVTIAMVKAAIAAIKGLVALIAAGGWVAVVIILIICLIGLLVGSIFGIFFSGEDSGTGRSMPTVVTELTIEFYDKIEDIKNSNPHDVVVEDAMSIRWNEVLAVYAVKINTDPESGMEVVSLDDDKVDKLRGILNDMVSLSHYTKTETQKRTVTDDDGNETTETETITTLIITLEHKSAEDMAAQYGFSQTQKENMRELLDPEYAYLWAQLLGGYVLGNGEFGIPDPSRMPKDIFTWPLGAGFSITSYFGYRADPFTQETKYHGGIDISAPAGTPILAMADGTVVVANSTDSWGGSYGYHIKIYHNDTYSTLYAHCLQICVVNGQEVKQGQVIGYVGSTGRSTGNHLHFEVYKNGSRTNPLDYFA